MRDSSPVRTFSSTAARSRGLFDAATRGRTLRARLAGVLLAFCSVLLCPSLSRAEDSSAPTEKGAIGLTFDCAGRASEEKSLPTFANGAEAKFEVTATFGEGAIVVLVDPQTSAV